MTSGWTIRDSTAADRPPDVERLDISVQRKDRQAAIRIGLFDPQGVRGIWGDKAADKYLTRENATPGMARGALQPGPWRIELLPTRIGSQGCDIEIDVAFQRKRPRWLKGDIHLHTYHSDGHDSPEVVIDRCRDMGLDFIAITEHDTRTSHDYLPLREGFTVLPGIELSSHRGHANCIGVDNPYTNGMFFTEEEVRRALQEARDKGAFISLNHPFDWDPGCQWRWSWDLPFDAIEVVNGPWRPTNGRAVDWWQALLCRGEKLPVVGGSDAHTCFELTLAGMPTTWVYADENSRESIVAALKGGRSFLTISPKGPSLQIEGHTPGDTVQCRVGSSLQFPIDIHLNPGSVVRIITRKGEALKASAECDTYHVDFEMKVEDDDFMRVEAWEYMEEYDRSMLTLLANPVYVRVGGG